MDATPRRRTASQLRRTGSQLIFGWGSVLSASCYAVLTVLGESPIIDDHLTVTAVSMLLAYLVLRAALHSWLIRSERLHEPEA